ncbi:MAG TPA: hypothetical protein VGQ46_19470 [Thermoanaerobaculia bacterium]|jgi:hypothetical protein|nr:hypothetical protein [Thermoanaerobaculia bacterium]
MKMTSTYAWNRFWCPREGSYSLTADGFLREPHKRYRVGDVKAFAEISDIPVLLLLGEPGIGKTFAITAERESIHAAVAQRCERILWPDLQEVDSSERFDRVVIDTPEFQAWLKGESILHLYLDALDECMLRVRTLGRLLINALQDGPAERLRLRLTCRTAEWSNELEIALKRLLGENRVQVFELLPLTRADVAQSLLANGIDEAAFFDYVDRTSASALASRPVPLNFLIRCFRRGDLPATQIDLYERGCLSLCEESEHRVETGLQPVLNPAERLAIAKRIAACTMFSTRSLLLFGHEDADTPTDAVRITELAGGYERLGNSALEVTEAALRSTLDTGLFTSRGAKILGWAHHTYEEYLAAQYVSDSNLSAEQILPLIVHPDDSDRKLTPQLHGVAAWLAVIQPAIFRYVAAHEPELILLSDVVIERNEDRSLVIRELLQRKRSQQLARIDVMAYPKFRKLGYPDIAEQLRPVLMSADEPERVRELAADIAKYTECLALIPELTQIALDTMQPLNLRVDATSSVARHGNEAQRAALKPLLDGKSGSRQERWLIRLALKAAWPHAVSANDLFAFLGPRQRRLGAIGDDYTLVEHIGETLTDEHLGPALKWVLRRVHGLPEGPIARFRDALQRLEDRIIMRAWRSDDDAVTAVLAQVVVEKIRRYERLISRDDLEDEDLNDKHLTDDGPRRLRFLTFLLPALAGSEKTISAWLIFAKTKYLRSDDFVWLVKRQASVEHRNEEWALEADLLLRLANLTVPATLDLVLNAAAHNPVLAERVKSTCDAVPLDSEEARQARLYHAEMEESERQTKRKRRVPENPVRVVEWLKETEKQPCVHWRLLEEMARTPDNDLVNSMNLDVQSFPGWITSDEETREKTIATAERFLRECDPDADSWFGTQQFDLSAMGGVRALTLLKTAAPHRFASLDTDIWQKWTPALLGIPNNDRTVPLLSTAYRKAPDEVIHRLQQLVRAKDAYVINKLSDVLDDPLVAALLAVAREGGIPDETLTRLLEPLLQNVEARHFAEALVRDSSDAGLRDRAVSVAATLLLRVPNESWDAIWPFMTEDAAFGRAVIELAVNRDHLEASPVYTLDESHIADLYLWLAQEYPMQDDPEHEGTFTPDTRDKISSWCSRCLDSLKRRGTRAACDSLRRLAAERPDETYLWPLIVEAESARRQKSWQPTPVAVFRELLSDRSRRQVRSETELADVIVESLGRLQNKLQGETPSAFDLWNTSPYKPKSENEFSNYVTRHLRDDLKGQGVIIAREVEIRPSASPRSGERTDIHVDVAIDIERKRQTFSVIVESKSCWNQGLCGAMTQQLAHRYLRDNAIRTGIFLVGWFQCSIWDSADRRKRGCNADPVALTTTLANEAAALRAEGLDIRPILLNCSLR